MTVLPMWFGELWHVRAFSLDPEADLHELHSNQRMHGSKQYLFLRMIGKRPPFRLACFTSTPDGAAAIVFSMVDSKLLAHRCGLSGSSE